MRGRRSETPLPLRVEFREWIQDGGALYLKDFPLVGPGRQTYPPGMSSGTRSFTDSIELPADLSAKAALVPGLPERLLRFIRMEVAMDERRRRRHSPEALALLQRARLRADAQPKSGDPDRVAAMNRFEDNFEAIVKEL